MRTVVPSKMRRSIAFVTSASFSSIPHYHVIVEIDARMIFACAKKNGVKPVDVILYYTSRLLREYELLNGYWEEDLIHLYDEVNLGYIVSVDDGLLVPVIRQADRLELHEIYTLRRDLVVRALAHRLLPDEYRGGTFTVSNLGTLPVESFTGIILQRQSGLLTLGRLYQDRPSKISLVCDHRLVDGLYAARFLTSLKQRLETSTV